MTKQLKVISAFNAIVTVLSVNGGWTTVKMEDGSETKVRNSALRDLTEAELAGVKGSKAPAAKKSPAKPAKAPAVKKAKTLGKGGEVVRDLEDSADDEEDNAASRAGLVQPDYAKYVRHDVKSPSGRKCLDIDDAAAKLLRGADISDCYFIVAKNIAKAEGGDADQIEADLKAKYEHLNVGMQRMNLGNRLRKAMGIYGNLNAHKNPRQPKPKADKAPAADRAGSKEHADFEAAHGEQASITKYGRRADDRFKRKNDPKPAA